MLFPSLVVPYEKSLKINTENFLRYQVLQISKYCMCTYNDNIYDAKFISEDSTVAKILIKISFTAVYLYIITYIA